MRTILVTGARAKTGSPLVDILTDRTGIDIRAGSSNPDSLEPDTALPVAFNWDESSTWGPAVDSIDGVFIVRPDRPDAPALISEFIAVTPETAHIVLLSEINNGYFSDDDWAMRVEHTVRTSDRTWTILRPGWFMQVFTDPRFFRDDIVDNGQLNFVSGGRGVAWIDTRDIATVAATALTEPGHDAQVYDLTGPEALTLDQTATALASVIGHDVDHIEISMEDALGDSEGFQRENDYGAFDRIRNGVNEVVTDTVERVTGNPSRSFEQFLDDHVETLRPTLRD